MELLGMIRKRPGLFLACAAAGVAPVLMPLLIRGPVVYLVGPKPH